MEVWKCGGEQIIIKGEGRNPGIMPGCRLYLTAYSLNPYGLSLLTPLPSLLRCRPESDSSDFPELSHRIHSVGPVHWPTLVT